MKTTEKNQILHKSAENQAENHLLNQNFSQNVPVAVVGARGYTGLELCRLLLRHSRVQLKSCIASDGAFRLQDALPEESAKAVQTLSVAELIQAPASAYSVVFLATPAEVSLELAPQFLKKGISVIDLSGAYRLQAGSSENQKFNYKKWYSMDHSDLSGLQQAEYGLVPWCSQEAKSGSPRLISNPGCYASAVLLAILPLLKSNLIEAQSLVIDAKSGTTGAGKKASESLLYSEVESECLPYKVGQHQHFPEIQQWVETFTGKVIDPFFATSLLSARRGIIASVYTRLKTGVTAAEIAQAFESCYVDYPLVKVMPLEVPVGKLAPLSMYLRSVVGSARTHIHYHVQGEKLYLFSLIDNLIKGAAGQAIENLNRLQGWNVETGLLSLEGVL